MNVLIRLHKGYGLGDAAQMSAVLRHVAKYRSNWVVDYQGEHGFHKVGNGIVKNTFSYDDPYPSDHYDAEVLICLYDTWANWHDRPNTRVSSCLHECFGLGWDAECGRYQINVSRKAADDAKKVLQADNLVAVHYEGDSSPTKKNLTHKQADQICRHISELGYIPIVLDWRVKCPLEYRKMRAPAAWGRDAEMVCAVISQCRAFVGIDSGPSKCASSTDTPALVVWTGHSPIAFHDPADNTTHLAPIGYNGCYPIVTDRKVVDWFEAHHNILWYGHDPVGEIKLWLEKTLK